MANLKGEHCSARTNRDGELDYADKDPPETADKRRR
jgi:hypothetical protein